MTSIKQSKSFFQAGFSLLELLVVISLISILIAVVSVAFSTAQVRGRDSKRRSDIKQMENAFEQYYAANGTYANCTTMATLAMPGGLPTDPKPNHTAYNTATGCSASEYCVCALLEDTGNGNATAPTGSSCNFGAGDYVCATNLQ